MLQALWRSLTPQTFLAAAAIVVVWGQPRRKESFSVVNKHHHYPWKVKSIQTWSIWSVFLYRRLLTYWSGLPTLICILRATSLARSRNFIKLHLLSQPHYVSTSPSPTPFLFLHSQTPSPSHPSNPHFLPTLSPSVYWSLWHHWFG